LAQPCLGVLKVPTLLIVSEYDTLVPDLNRTAQRVLACANRLAIMPGASNLFEEPGTLEQVADLARDWFVRHLRATETSAR